MALYIYLNIAILQCFAEDTQNITIIPRASWGANSLYNDINSEYWRAILTARANYIAPYRSPESIAISQEKTRKINDYLNENFLQQFTYQEKITHNLTTGQEYAWDLGYSSYVDSIIVHHTHSEYDNDITGLNQMHKYHSINRQWGDIGYNYIIGYDGVIYQGREGGDYVVGAHSTYNNIGSVGIAVLGNYDSDGINQEQYKSLEELIQFLTKKYGIDLNSKRYYHMDCIGEKCNDFPIETYLDSTLVGHRDTGHTTCPGEKLYEQIEQIRNNNINSTKGYTNIIRGDNTSGANSNPTYSSSKIQKLLMLLKKYSYEEREEILKLIDIKLETEKSENMIEIFKMIKISIIISRKDG